jgi:hypothetical protein
LPVKVRDVRSPKVGGSNSSFTSASRASGYQVGRCARLSIAEFIREYRDPKKPVILTDATRHWQAHKKFSFDFFKSELGHREVVIDGKTYRLREFIDLLLASNEKSPAPYPCKLNVRRDFADLAPHFPRYGLADPDRVHHPLLPRRYLDGLHDLEVFIGGPGGKFPYLHYDHLGLFAYINMIVGEKEFTIFTPDQTRFLYPNPKEPWISEMENHHQPDLLRYPLYAQARPSKVVLKAGETLFIPCGWWHTARSLSPSISVAFDQLCSSNWNFFVKACCDLRRDKPIQRLMTRAVLKGTGRLIDASERLCGLR